MTKDTTQLPIARRMAAVALLSLGLQWPFASHAGCSIGTVALPVKMVGTRAIATVGINGTQVPLLVDTGAFFSFLTEAAAQQLGLRTRALPGDIRVQGLTGSVAARLTTVDHLKLLDGDMPGMEFIVGGNEAGSGAMGLLGRNILGAMDTEYDLAHGVIRFVVPGDGCEKANMAYWAGDTPVAMVELLKDYRLKRPLIRARVELNGHAAIAMFDTGATTTVSLDAAHSAGVKDAAMTATGLMTGAGSGKAKAWTAPFDSISLGGETVRHNQMEVADFDLPGTDMLVGIDFFLSHRIYIAQKQSRMFFTYNGGPVFALNASAPPDPAASRPDAAAGEKMSADEYARRGAASLARRDAAAALADLDRACAQEPGNAAFFAMRASVHLALKQEDKALSDLDTALQLDAGQAEARIERSAIRRTRNERGPVLDDLSALDRTLPPQSQIRQRMALLYESMDMPAQALAQWNLWIAAHRHDIALEHAYNGRCWARVQLDIELDKALDDCDEAVDADSKNASYLDSRAWVFARLGRWQRAKSEFDRALAVKPDQAESLYGRALVHQHLDEPAGALADLAAARKIAPAIDADIARYGLPTVKP
ncbi:aspartyl protease family protein [Scleromatobacter humisilvae]|uniref:Aspartyl protease family protein n=1 Tax=Scleromatobacter humisilvae TaxID=2897159 RepID=A0A9X2C0X9_9BURK|nr:aspartyl protease family protein [Scleromatobacter humisilvae]MCK9686956.1 aspartyl protease family protein [Scleromatobacter humisilvae]